ncbi:MAG TPA: ATP-binding protein [Candidatus Acidoferrales bacterium]|jgi:signal transduction histidine kinase|nr:ATP-binding protein [Candidatus Acidoferrales bacterium]
MASVTQKKTTGSTAVSSTAVATDLSANLRRLDRLANLGLVSASIAHEIKNGLVAIGTFVDMLVEKSEDKEMTDVVRRELRRINSLTTQMLRYSAPKPVAFSKVRTHELLDHSLRLLEHQMNGRLITLKREYLASADSVHGEESQLQQAFMNLFLNAVEAVGSNGEVCVTTESNGTHLKISVRDSGPGIPQENLSRMFEPFFTTKKNGTGLGLAICQRIVEEHRGQIEVQSETGAGSVFIVSLPRE